MYNHFLVLKQFTMPLPSLILHKKPHIIVISETAKHTLVSLLSLSLLIYYVGLYL